MEKRCFVIMPISDCEGYPQGHFTRVYKHIIKPACETAGFKPIRADDIMTTNYIALDIIKNILDCEMAICDLSARNPNVLYELGIRQAFNKPVTLIKDAATNRIFDIQGFRDVEYDSSLRIDTVQTTTSALAEVIKNTFENKATEINSLIGLLGIEPAKVSERTKISAETELILGTISSLEQRLRSFENIQFGHLMPSPGIPQREDFERRGGMIVLAEVREMKVGDTIFHDNYGPGLVVGSPSINEQSKRAQVAVEFKKSGIKTLLVPHPRVRRLLNSPA